MCNWCFTTSPGWPHLLCSSGWPQACSLSTLVSWVIGCMHVPLYLVPPYSLCVYLCGRYIHVCAFMCICVWGLCWVFFFLSTLFLQDRASHWTRSSPFRLDYLVPLISVPPVLGDAMPGFYAGALDPNSGLYVSTVTLYPPSCLPSPCHLFFQGSHAISISAQLFHLWNCLNDICMKLSSHSPHCSERTLLHCHVCIHWPYISYSAVFYHPIPIMINTAETTTNAAGRPRVYRWEAQRSNSWIRSARPLKVCYTDGWKQKRS